MFSLLCQVLHYVSSLRRLRRSKYFICKFCDFMMIWWWYDHNAVCDFNCRTAVSWSIPIVKFSKIYLLFQIFFAWFFSIFFACLWISILILRFYLCEWVTLLGIHLNLYLKNSVLFKLLCYIFQSSIVYILINLLFLYKQQRKKDFWTITMSSRKQYLPQP